VIESSAMGSSEALEEVTPVTIPGFELQQAHWPWVFLRRQRTWDDLKGLLGAKDVEVGDTEFDRMLRVTSEDPEFVRMLLGEGLRRWLINLQMDDFSLEIGGSWIMLSGQDQKLDGLFILGLEALAGFKERVPSDLRKV
jgi:hypothetical protein